MTIVLLGANGISGGAGATPESRSDSDRYAPFAKPITHVMRVGAIGSSTVDSRTR